MRSRWGRRLIAVGATAAIAGSAGALALSAVTPATASAGAIWTSYDLSSQNGVQASGQPSLLADPGTGQQDIATATPSGGIEIWQGDGQSGVTAQFMNSNSDNPVSTQYDTGNPSLVKDPQSGDLDVFTDSQGSFLEEYDRNPSSNQWSAYNVSYTVGQYIDGSPSATVVGGDLNVAASNNDNLVDFTRGSSWTVTNVSTTTGTNITSDTSPVTLTDPFGGYADDIADGSGDVIQFTAGGGTWNHFDETAGTSRPTISGDPTAIADGQQLLVFADSPNGDLIEYERASDGSTWTSSDLTTEFGGPTIDSDPSAVIDGSDVDVFAEGADDNLIEYSDVGTGWVPTDLTTADGADQIASAPAATISASTGNLAVFATSPSGDLVESEYGTPPAPAATTTSTSPSTSTPTPTPVTTPTPAPTPRGTRKSVKVKVTMVFRQVVRRRPLKWELVSAAFGTLKADEGVRLACRGTGPTHRTGCPDVARSATGKAGIRRLVRKLLKTEYGVGAVLTLTVSETGLKPEVARITIRRALKPAVALVK